MATKKKLLQAAAGTAAAGGGAALSVEDVFSTYLYEGNGDFQAIGNGINLGQSNDGGSVLLDAGQNNYIRPSSNSGFALGTGAFTIEAFYFHRGSVSDLGPQFFDWDGTSSQLWFGFYGTELYLRTASNSDLAPTVSQQVETWTHVAAVRDSSGNVSVYHNGTRVASGTGFNATNVTGTQPYIGSNAAGGVTSYTDGFLSNVRISNTARYSGASITVPTSGFTSDSNTILLTAQGDSPLTDNSSNALSITTNGDVTASTFGPFDAAEAGEGGMVWLKPRASSDSHFIFDTERGATKFVRSEGTNAESTQNNTLTSFNSNGFSIGDKAALNNTNGNSVASWTFRKAPKFFTCIQYTGDGTNPRTISHDLGHDVGMMVIKRTDSAGGWFVWHRSVTGYGSLNATDSWNSYTGIWADTNPTSTSFTVDNNTQVNASGGTYVAYLFAHNDGDGGFGPDGDADIIKCGTIVPSTSTVVDLGWEPQWILVKSTTNADDWYIFDTMRGLLGDFSGLNYLEANTSLAEQTGGTTTKITPTGFEFNYGAGQTYIYVAIRRGPMAVPTDATEVFAIDDAHAASGSGPAFVSNFVTDMVLEKQPTTSSDWYAITRLMGNKYVRPNSTGVEATGASTTWDYMNGAGDPFSSSPSFQGWMWKRAPSYFDVVAYTGNGTAGRTVSHNLGVAPEMMWVKNRDSAVNWLVYHKDVGAGYYGVLSGTNVFDPSNNAWNSTAPTDTDFTLGIFSNVNSSGSDYIAYLFASLDGVSKVGSFTMAGSDINVDCGFSSGARFVLLKRTDSTGNWLVFDSERGIVAGADPYLLLNTTDAEDTFGALDIIDPLSSGFTAVSANIANGDWIFYAIA